MRWSEGYKESGIYTLRAPDDGNYGPEAGTITTIRSGCNADTENKRNDIQGNAMSVVTTTITSDRDKNERVYTCLYSP